MKEISLILIGVLLAAAMLLPKQADSQTFCNPLNISYRFSLDKVYGDTELTIRSLNKDQKY